jgi:hypothetical protein
MLYSEIVAVCSEIRTKHINAMWAPRRIFVMLNLAVHKVTTGLYRVTTYKLLNTTEEYCTA